MDNMLSNRMELFRYLTSKELDSEVNESIFKVLLDNSYEKFVETCEYVKENLDKISSVSCFIEDGNVVFTYHYYDDDIGDKGK